MTPDNNKNKEIIVSDLGLGLATDLNHNGNPNEVLHPEEERKEKAEEKSEQTAN